MRCFDDVLELEGTRCFVLPDDVLELEYTVVSDFHFNLKKKLKKAADHPSNPHRPFG